MEVGAVMLVESNFSILLISVFAVLKYCICHDENYKVTTKASKILIY